MRLSALNRTPLTVRRSLWLVPLLALVLEACSTASAPQTAATRSPEAPPSSAPSSSAPSPAGSTPAAGAGLLLKVTNEGGLIAPGAQLAALPSIAVYSDGRIFSPTAVPAIYPGPLLPFFQVRDVGPAGAAAIEDAIRAAGLDAPAQTDPGVVPDVGVTVITAVLDGVTTTARFPGLTGAPGRPDMSGSDPRAAAARALLDRLGDPSDTWGGAAGQQTIYKPTAYRIFVAPGGPAQDAQLPQVPMTWPLATPLVDFGTPVAEQGIAGLRSGVVKGEDAATLTEFLRKANVLTPIVSGDRAWTIFVRPLLPGETEGG